MNFIAGVFITIALILFLLFLTAMIADYFSRREMKKKFPNNFPKTPMALSIAFLLFFLFPKNSFAIMVQSSTGCVYATALSSGVWQGWWGKSHASVSDSLNSGNSCQFNSGNVYVYQGGDYVYCGGAGSFTTGDRLGCYEENGTIYASKNGTVVCSRATSITSGSYDGSYPEQTEESNFENYSYICGDTTPTDTPTPTPPPPTPTGIPSGSYFHRSCSSITQMGLGKPNVIYTGYEELNYFDNPLAIINQNTIYCTTGTCNVTGQKFEPFPISTGSTIVNFYWQFSAQTSQLGIGNELGVSDGISSAWGGLHSNPDLNTVSNDYFSFFILEASETKHFSDVVSETDSYKLNQGYVYTSANGVNFYPILSLSFPSANSEDLKSIGGVQYCIEYFNTNSNDAIDIETPQITEGATNPSDFTCKLTGFLDFPQFALCAVKYLFIPTTFNTGGFVNYSATIFSNKVPFVYVKEIYNFDYSQFNLATTAPKFEFTYPLRDHEFQASFDLNPNHELDFMWEVFRAFMAVVVWFGLLEYLLHAWKQIV